MSQMISGTGYCKKCGEMKTTINNQLPICLDCDVQENKPSGRVVTVNDPGHDKMMAIENGQKVSSPIKENVSLSVDCIQLRLTLEELESNNLQDLVVQRIIEALDELPCPKMKDAKRIMKIQDKLEAK